MIVEILLVGGAALVGGVLIAGGWAVGVYNSIQTALQDIAGMWSNLKTEYQRRADLFYNLVASVKGSAKFEKDAYIGIALGRSGRSTDDAKMFASARKGKLGKDQTEEMASMTRLNTLFMNMMGRMEAYPELKTTAQFIELQGEMRMTEDRIQVARTDYNKIVEDYNTYIKMFPTFVLANMFGAKPAAFFELDDPEKDNKAPRIDFSEGLQ